MAELKAKMMEEEMKDAKLEMWTYALGFTPTAVVKCAIELRIAETIEAHGGAITHAALSSAVSCSPPVLRRIMRYLVHRRFFKQTTIAGEKPEPSVSYSLTTLSRLLLRNAAGSMAALVLLESTPPMLAPWHRLSARARERDGSPFEEEHGVDIWAYTNANPAHSKLVDEAMSCIATASAAAIANHYPAAFQGIASLVDVGGGDGTALRILVKAFPWIRGVNFDLPHVVRAAQPCMGVEHVAGDMFESVPKADAAFLMVRSLLNAMDDRHVSKYSQNQQYCRF